MSKERTISLRLSPETESKLNWLIKESNTGDIVSESSLTDVVERCIHNEWCSINYANLNIIEDVILDENYLNMINHRATTLVTDGSIDPEYLKSNK